MTFDPLDFFTPQEEHFEEHLEEQQCVEPLVVTKDREKYDAKEKDEEEEEESRIHILDLPPLTLCPPFNALSTILELLEPQPICNFTIDQTVLHRSSHLHFTEILHWFQNHWPPLASKQQLLSVARNAHVLRLLFMAEYNAYMTQIISSNLCWMLESQRESIQATASCRLAENCGRTAQPGLVRKITIDGLAQNLFLQEPALTSDNLGLKTWGLSLVLSQRLVGNPSHYLAGPIILELGAGTGLVGLVCDKLGYHTVLTDLPDIIPNLAHNVELNCAKLKVFELDWSTFTNSQQKTYRTIIASDPVYSEQHPPWLVRIVDQLLEASENARVLVQVPLRDRFEKERELLWDCFAGAGFMVMEHVVEQGHDDFGAMKYLFKMLKRRL